MDGGTIRLCSSWQSLDKPRGEDNSGGSEDVVRAGWGDGWWDINDHLLRIYWFLMTNFVENKISVYGHSVAGRCAE